jgi:hypothetical protein
MNVNISETLFLRRGFLNFPTLVKEGEGGFFGK